MKYRGMHLHDFTSPEIPRLHLYAVDMLVGISCRVGDYADQAA